MAQTVTAIAGCNVAIDLDNAGGTPTDVSGSSTGVTPKFNSKIGEAFTFLGEYPIRIQCKRDSAMTIKALYTRDATEVRGLIEAWYQSGGLRTLAVYPEGKVNGARFYSAEYLLESFDFDLGADNADPVMMNIELKPSGAVTFDNYTTA